MSPEKVQSILDNNQFFPHLYEPYYERKDVKSNLMSILKDQHSTPEDQLRGASSTMAQSKNHYGLDLEQNFNTNERRGKKATSNSMLSSVYS